MHAERHAYGMAGMEHSTKHKAQSEEIVAQS